MGIKLLHTADLHLDRPFLVLGERRVKRRAEMRARFEEIVRAAREHEVDGLLVAGDLFDRAAADSGAWVKAHLASLAAQGIKVFLIPGNHDALPGCSFYTGGFPEGIHVFKEPEPAACDLLPGVTVYGLAYAAAGRRQSPLQGLDLDGGARWRVGLVHGQLRATELFGDDYAPFTAAEVAGSGLDYLALGHYHGRLDCSAGRTKACYPGSPHRLDFGDIGERALLLVELEEGGVKVTALPLKDRAFLQIEGDVEKPEGLYEKLINLDPESCVRVRLTGRAAGPLAGLVEDLREKFGGRFFGFEIAEEISPAGGAAGQPGTVAHAFAQAMAGRVEAAAEDEEKALARLAADYGLLALEGRPLP